MMKKNYNIAFFLLYSFLLCDAFSTYSKQMLKGGFVVVPPVCFVTPRKSFLQVASPTSDLDENKQEKKKRLRKLKDSFKVRTYVYMSPPLLVVVVVFSTFVCESVVIGILQLPTIMKEILDNQT